MSSTEYRPQNVRPDLGGGRADGDSSRGPAQMWPSASRRRPDEPTAAARTLAVAGSATSRRDHGQVVVGAWRDKSETPSSGVIMGKWSPGQPVSHDHDAERRGVGLDHGSSPPGTAI